MDGFFPTSATLANPFVNMDCSIIICTRNRASALARTLQAFQQVKVPHDWQVEIIIADNGSIDQTATVAQSATHPAIQILYLYEPQRGKSRAQNAAIAVACGEVLLFTDDDVEPAADWIELMARPLLENRCDAVTGRVLLAEELRRPWFTHMHKRWLSDIPEPKVNFQNTGLIGANMGIRREVFDQNGHFDEELGPGATGLGEETLLWMQMKEAGMRILPLNDTCVIHRPDASRLLRSNWLAAAARYGRTRAYLMHHWEHAPVPYPWLLLIWTQLKLSLRRLTCRSFRMDDEGCPDWEMSYLARISACRHYIGEADRPRNYQLPALRRKNALLEL
ncbi:MAG: glycosyltransferase family 2 protein [Verrucomicrobiota bacterium]